MTPRADGTRLNRQTHSQRGACPNIETKTQHDSAIPSPLCRSVSSEAAEFLALFETLASANHALLSYFDKVVASIHAPGAQPLIEKIAKQTETIRDRMSLMAKLAAELKDTPD